MNYKGDNHQMLNYLIKNRAGQFLLIGTLFIISGFILMLFTDISSSISFYIAIFFLGFFTARKWLYRKKYCCSISFYIAIFFLGFFTARNAVIETVKSKSPNVDLLMILAAIGAVIIGFESE